MSKKDKLEKYNKKRDFKKSPEPKDEGGVDKDESIFVIQKHDASNLHYDFRLEIEGVLASWAVPKGPSTDPSEKRLALPTEDHPLDYAKFEGKIPEGQYGAGTVIVWDFGTYENLKGKSMDKAKKEGKIEINLKGEKLKGGFVLIRTNNKDKDDSRWLLIKMDDEQADARRKPIKTEPKSVLSGKTLEEMKEAM